MYFIKNAKNESGRDTILTSFVIDAVSVSPTNQLTIYRNDGERFKKELPTEEDLTQIKRLFFKIQDENKNLVFIHPHKILGIYDHEGHIGFEFMLGNKKNNMMSTYENTERNIYRIAYHVANYDMDNDIDVALYKARSI